MNLQTSMSSEAYQNKLTKMRPAGKIVKYWSDPFRIKQNPGITKKNNSTWKIIMEVWFRSFSFLFMGDGCRFLSPFIETRVFLHGQNPIVANFLNAFNDFQDSRLGSPKLLRNQSADFLFAISLPQLLSCVKVRQRFMKQPNPSCV